METSRPLPFLALAAFQSYTDRGGVVDGRYYHGLYGHNEGWDYFGQKSLVGVWDVKRACSPRSTGVQPYPGMDVWDLDVGEDDWELYEVELESRTSTPTGIFLGDRSYYESHIDGACYVYLPGIEGGTQVYERTEAGYELRLQAQGWMSRLFRVR